MITPRYLYRGTTTLHYGGSLLWMHADPDPITGFTDRLYFTDDPSRALVYTSPNAFAGLSDIVGGKPMVIRIDVEKEPELRRLLRKGKSEPDEWYAPVGILKLRHQPLVVMVGRTGRSQTERAPHFGL